MSCSTFIALLKPSSRVGEKEVLTYSERSFHLLPDGRYDTPHHPLFRTLNEEHCGDFYQPCEPGIKPNVGPRMPWQDIHAKIEGPAARDIMMNFVER